MKTGEVASSSLVFLGLALLLGPISALNLDVITPGLDALIKLHTATCPSMDLCTVEAKPANLSETYEYDESANCCPPPCFCNATCLLDDNCCPDYPVTLLNDAVYHGERLPDPETLQSWIRFERGSVMYDKYIFSIMQIYPNSTDDPDAAFILDDTECIDMTFPPNNHLISAEPAYYVFNNCSFITFENETEIVDMCSQVNKRGDAYTLSDITPVVSVYSHLTYRNKYCLACSEPFSKWEPWEALLVCLKDKQVHIPAAEQLDDVVKFVTDENDCSLIFRLQPFSMGNMFALTCQNVHIKSCNVTGLWRNYDQNIDEACQRYRSPITAVIEAYSNQSITFNNIACLQCNLPGGDIHDTCLSKQPNISDYYVSVKLNTEGKDIGFAPSPDFPREYYADPERQNCEKGQLYDNIIGQCRQTYCPRYHAVKHEMCSPIFDNMNGVALSLQLKLKLDTSSFANGVDLALQDGSFMYFDNLGLRVCSTSIWRKYVTLDGGNIDYLFIPLTLTTDFYSYNTLLHFAQSLIDTEMPFGDVKDLDERKINYTLTFADDNVMRTDHDEITVIDLSDGRELQESGVRLTAYDCKVSLTITVISFCERVALNVNEYEIRGESLFLKLNKSLIHGTNFDLLEDRRALICIEKYKQMLKRQTIDQEVQLADVQNDYLDTFDTDAGSVGINTSFFLGIIVSTIFLSGLLVTLGLIRKQYFSTHLQQQNHITMRTSPIEESQDNLGNA